MKKNTHKKIKIAVFGGREADAELLLQAEALGEGIAKRGWVLLCGGRGGIMEAVSRGCHKAGGMAVGILPGTDEGDANSWLDLAIPTGIGFARNAVLAQACDAAVAIGGRYGTLSEVAYALEFGKTLISLDSWNIPGCIVAADAAAALEELDRIIAQKETI